MSDPKGPFEAAVRAGCSRYIDAASALCSYPNCNCKHMPEVFRAFVAAAFPPDPAPLEVTRNDGSYVAERAKPAASDEFKKAWAEIERLGSYTHPGMSGGDIALLIIAPRLLRTILTAALAERGRVERERAAQICESHLEGTLSDKDGVHYVLFPKKGDSKDGMAYAAAIRNQTLTGD